MRIVHSPVFQQGDAVLVALAAPLKEAGYSLFWPVGEVREFDPAQTFKVNGEAKNLVETILGNPNFVEESAEPIDATYVTHDVALTIEAPAEEPHDDSEPDSREHEDVT